jgi:hypothetical protein
MGNLDDMQARESRNAHALETISIEGTNEGSCSVRATVINQPDTARGVRQRSLIETKIDAFYLGLI